jgi:hypothetical protein
MEKSDHVLRLAWEVCDLITREGGNPVRVAALLEITFSRWEREGVK